MADQNKKTILVVEDDVFLVKAYQIKFQKEGINVQAAHDGKEALSFLQKDPPTLVLLDLMLPYIAGFDVLQAIRKNDRWKDVPVIITSNLGQEQDIEQGKTLGATDYIIKANSKIGDLVERVRKHL